MNIGKMMMITASAATIALSGLSVAPAASASTEASSIVMQQQAPSASIPDLTIAAGEQAEVTVTFNDVTGFRLVDLPAGMKLAGSLPWGYQKWFSSDGYSLGGKGIGESEVTFTVEAGSQVGTYTSEIRTTSGVLGSWTVTVTP